MALLSHAPALLPWCSVLRVEVILARSTGLSSEPEQLQLYCELLVVRCSPRTTPLPWCSGLRVEVILARPYWLLLEPDQRLQLYCEPLPWRCSRTRLRCCLGAASCGSRSTSPAPTGFSLNQIGGCSCTASRCHGAALARAYAAALVQQLAVEVMLARSSRLRLEPEQQQSYCELL